MSISMGSDALPLQMTQSDSKSMCMHVHTYVYKYIPVSIRTRNYMWNTYIDIVAYEITCSSMVYCSESYYVYTVMNACVHFL